MGRGTYSTNNKKTENEKIENAEVDYEQSRCAEGHPTSEVRDFMMFVGVQDNCNIVEPEPLVVPGAVAVRPSDDTDDDPRLNLIDENEDMSVHPIVAHLAPDDTDLEAMFEERLAARIAQELQDSRSQKMSNTSEVYQFRNKQMAVVASEVKDEPSPSGFSRRSQWTVIILLIFIVGGVVVYFLQRGNNSENATRDSMENLTMSESEAPTFSPLPLDPLVEELRYWIAPTSEDLMPFQNPSSPQSQALAWLQDDPITLSPDRSTRTVLERYVLAVLYYSTSGPLWRLSYLISEDVCMWNNGRQTISSQDVNFTLDMNGVYCLEDGESVNALVLLGNTLRGPLPWELVLLTNLEVINLDLNGLTGSIPSRIGELTNLKSIFLSNNGLTGSIPASISKLTMLEMFWAQQNALTGPLPLTLSPVTFQLFLDDNRLTGSIPETWGTSMPALEWVSLGGNSFNGTLPSTFGLLSNLHALAINNNLLTGTIPTELGLPNSLQSLSIEGNSFVGSVEQSLCMSLSELTSFSADCEEVVCPCCEKCCKDNQINCEDVEQ